MPSPGGGEGGGGGAPVFPPSGVGAAGGTAPSPPTLPAPSPPPPVTTCDGQLEKALPYAIDADFSFHLPLNSPTLQELPVSDCAEALPLDGVGEPPIVAPCATVSPDDGGAPPADGGVDAVDGAYADGSPSDGGSPDAVGDAVVTPDANPEGVGPIGRIAAPSSCYGFRYEPDACVAATGLSPACAVATCWSGFIFAPSSFGGPGICVAPGATRILFKARASRDGARVKFGSTRPGLFTSEFFLTLTTAWREYAIAIPAEDYDAEPSATLAGVWNGFSIVVEPEDHVGGTTILVADVVWTSI